MTARTSSTELLARLRRHYLKPGPYPGGVFIPEVTHEGHGARRVDALHVGFIRSRGLHLVGHELKVSRSDWLRELDDPTKADVWASQCHAWYVVAPSTAIVPSEELPNGWGLLVIDPRTKTRLRTVVPARVNPDVDPDWRTMLAVIKRLDTLHWAALAEARAAGSEGAQQELARLRAEASRLELQSPERLERELGELRSLVDELSAVLGLNVVQGRWADSGSVTLEQLRSSLGPWLRAARSADEAIAARRRGVEHAVESLTLAADAARAALAQLDGRRS